MRTPPPAATVRLDPTPTAASVGRAFVRDAIVGLDLDASYGVLLLTSELLTNAIRHGERTLQLSVAVDQRWVRIEVSDDGPGLPAPLEPDLLDGGGRGLLLVAALANDWGVRPAAIGETGKTVWFTVLV